MASIMWFRRDLRLRDNPALNAALLDGHDGVLPLFILDHRLWEASGRPRQAYLTASLRSLNASLGGHLHVQWGDPQVLVPAIARSVSATSVHIAEDFGPYGRVRDTAVEQALGQVPLVRTGSSYAVAPGRVTKSDGSPYRVFTPYPRAWLDHGWPDPASQLLADPDFLGRPQPLPGIPELDGVRLPAAGEQAAWEQWERFGEGALASYSSRRDRADLAGTSRLSQHLRWGEIHPRTLLSELTEADEVFRKELCWREFYADVLWHAPDSARASLDPRFDELPWARGLAADEALARWRAGTTGYPLIDAGMRQLLTDAWMHNRVRMVTASFLVKDLHLPWQLGARWFMDRLCDGDLASNAHGWQWVAGCGTDAAPFHRVFNPVLQGLKFDPDGDYVRRYVPELRHLPGAAAHEPWKFADGYAAGYPKRLVDHAAERLVALQDYATLRQTGLQ